MASSKSARRKSQQDTRVTGASLTSWVRCVGLFSQHWRPAPITLLCESACLPLGLCPPLSSRQARGCEVARLLGHSPACGPLYKLSPQGDKMSSPMFSPSSPLPVATCVGTRGQKDSIWAVTASWVDFTSYWPYLHNRH